MSNLNTDEAKQILIEIGTLEKEYDVLFAQYDIAFETYKNALLTNPCIRYKLDDTNISNECYKKIWSDQGCWWRRRLASWSLFPHHEGWGRVLRHGALQPLPQAQGRLGQAVLAPLARARSPFFSGVGGGERKLSDWVSGYSVELALLLAVRAPPPPRLPPPHIRGAPGEHH